MRPARSFARAYAANRRGRNRRRRRRRPGGHPCLGSNRLEALKADRTGQYSIRINLQWRICFQWPRGAAGLSNVEIVDYH
jgi:hypothetical protein